MKILEIANTPKEELIATVTAVLRNGGLVVYPTETTYGIGADAENADAIAKLIEYKSKRDGKPLSVAVSDQAMAEKYVRLNETARGVYKTFLPGPVTVISTGIGRVAPGVASSTGGVGIRIPKYPLILELIALYGKGITATGANASYQKRPYTIQDIFDNISEKQKEMIDLVLDAGELPHNEPSTVIDTTLDDIQVMRMGEVAFGDEEVVETKSAEETIATGASFISKYRSKLTYEPLIIALSGPMGAGKTQFAKGIAKGLRIETPVVSPTYILESEYPFISEGQKGLFVHIDTWRMERVEELKQLQLDALVAKKAVIAIEWADRFADAVDELASVATVIWVGMEPLRETERKIRIVHRK